MKIVFMGTPEFAESSLAALLSSRHQVIGVFTQPDKPKGRGYKLVPPPVKELAMAHSIPVYQPQKMRDGEALSILQELQPDLIAVVAYGKILPKEILELPKYGCINVHGSLLPKYRGAAPIQWAVLNGDEVTGVSTMYLAHDMDAGDIIYTEETPIGEYETAGELFDRLADMGAKLLVRTLRDIEAGTAPRTPQEHEKASYVKQLEKSICPIDWTRTPREVIKHICGLNPWPVATMSLGGDTLKVYKAEYTDNRTDKAPGSVVSAGKVGLEMACGDGGTVMVTELQAPGKRRMPASAWLLGHPVKVE